MATLTQTAPSVATSGGDFSLRISQGLAAILSGRLRAINMDIALENAVKQHDNEISDLNTEQMHRGIRADGESIGEYADISYKGRLSPVDLYDEGDYHKSVHTEAFGKAFKLVASDWKADKLGKKYGYQILGLTRENIGEAAQIIKETVQDEVREQLR